MELTEFAVARPDEMVIPDDFASRPDWYKDWIAKQRPEGAEERAGWEPKRRGFVGVWFMRKDKDCQVRYDAELAPPDDLVNHCALIRSFWLEYGGYFRWAPSLANQFERMGVKVDIPESLTEERSWRLAEIEARRDKYHHEQPDPIQRVPEQTRQDAGESDS